MSEEATIAMMPPTLELVEHALREMEWEDRLGICKMTASAGNSSTHVYNLPSAVRLLFGTNWDAPLLEPGFKGGLTWVDVGQLVTWLRHSVGDAVLADEVESRALGLGSFQEQITEMRVVFTERMDQYRAVRDAAAAEQAEAERGE